MAKQVRTVQITYETDPEMETIDWYHAFEYSQYSRVLSVKSIRNDQEGESK